MDADPPVYNQPVLRPRWPEAKIEALQAETRAADPFKQDVARCKLAAHAADFHRARRLLRLLTDQYGRDGKLSRAADLFACAVIAGDLDLAGLLLTSDLHECCAAKIDLVTRGPSRPDLAEWTVDSERGMVFRIDAGVLSSPHTEFFLERLAALRPLFRAISGMASPPTGSVVINLGDAGEVPGLAFCSAMPACFLVPDPVFLLLDGYSHLAAELARDPVPWEDRKPVALWRGTTTGRRDPIDGSWRALPRARLCQLAAESRSPLLDVGLTDIVQIGDQAEDEQIRQSGLMRDYIAPERFQDYKYQIDMDGNSNSWPGLFQKLLTGSPVLKVVSAWGYRQWYYDRLEPWGNFVPVAEDCSDLVEKIEWLREHDKLAREIGAEGRRLALSMTVAGEVERARHVAAAAFMDARAERRIAEEALRPAAVTGSAAAEERAITIVDQNSRDPLIETVRAALQRALSGLGKLPAEVLSMEGMSGRKYRLFINNLIELCSNPSYLEIGVWGGSTLCAATWGNRVKATGIDNWSEFGDAKEKFLSNVKHFHAPLAEIRIIENDFRQIDFAALGEHKVYLFDGPHGEQDQYDGMALALPACADRFVMIVDDWNWPGPRQGTMRAITALNLTIEHMIEIRTTLDDTPGPQFGPQGDWHNGYFIGVLRKPAG